jgi:hypothetical protein
MCKSYFVDLSSWSPNPGVSMTVSVNLTPSSTSSKTLGVTSTVFVSNKLR